MIVTALKSQLLKGNTTTKLYHDYSSLNIDHFKENLAITWKRTVILNIPTFKNFFLEIIHDHAHIKKRS